MRRRLSPGLDVNSRCSKLIESSNLSQGLQLSRKPGGRRFSSLRRRHALDLCRMSISALLDSPSCSPLSCRGSKSDRRPLGHSRSVGKNQRITWNITVQIAGTVAGPRFARDRWSNVATPCTSGSHCRQVRIVRWRDRPLLASRPFFFLHMAFDMVDPLTVLRPMPVVGKTWALAWMRIVGRALPRRRENQCRTVIPAGVGVGPYWNGGFHRYCDYAKACRLARSARLNALTDHAAVTRIRALRRVR